MRLWLALLSVLLCGPLAAQTVVIATTGTFPPYLWEDGPELRGFDIDLMDEICAREGFECVYRVYPLTPGLEAVQRGEADIALGGLGITAERETYGNFTCPYTAGAVSLAPIFALDASVDPQTARIAVLDASIAHQTLVSQGYTAVPFDSLADAIVSTLTGATDAFHGHSDAFALVPGADGRFVVIGSVEVMGNGAGFLVSSARPDLLAALNDSFSVLERDGRLQELADTWFGPGQFTPPNGSTCGIVLARS